MSWNLIEALTGLWTGDDWDNNHRGKRVVTVKTHFPHDAGKLVTWDDEITRALVIIRNPMNAIPSFFNHIYEIRNKLAIHSQRAPVSDWIEWRDRQAKAQIRKFGEFVTYWMERFQDDRDRIFISYEMLTDNDDGPEEAIRINSFLARSKGVEPIATASVPCIWRAVVKYKDHASNPSSEKLDGGKRRLDPAHHDSQRSGPTERPYTPELLEAMSKMLLDLIQRWGGDHLRLRKMLEGYQQDVHAAYVAVNKSADNIRLSRKNFHIYQLSLSHTGTTILNNLLVGLFDPNSEYKKSSMVSKTHDVDLLNIYKREKANYDEVFFVVCDRGTDPNAQLDKELCDFNNVLCIEHAELQYNNQQELVAMVKNFANKVQMRFEYFWGSEMLDERNKMDAVNRLEAMDNAVAAVKNSPPAPKASSKKVRLEVNGKSFHIFEVSPPLISSAVATNWLMGLFEPSNDYAFMVNNRDQSVRQHDTTVNVESTVVTKTHILDLMKLYTQYRPKFGEIFFVVTNRGTTHETRIDHILCQYDNVLCIESEELVYNNNDGLRMIARRLTEKFRSRFEYFFGKNSDFLAEDKVNSAIDRLEEMAQVAASLSNQPYSVSDPKYGVHGGSNVGAGISSGVGSSFKGRLFFCGGPMGLLGTKYFKYSTFGLFLAKSLFPDFEGTIEIQPGNQVVNSATPLTEDTIKRATGNDLLIVHSHQHCHVPVEEFPGPQLHINPEYYDIHPVHISNPQGQFTLDYLPQGDK
ncbi:hypothetical protein ACHAWF_018391 [Thalassiosira exigua]